MKHSTPLFTTLLLSSLVTLHAEESFVYKKAGDRELKLFIEKPSEWKAEDQRPAIVNTNGLEQVDLNLSAGGGADSVLIGLLVPAVQKAQDSTARTNVDLGAGNNFSDVRYRGFAMVDRG